MVGDVYVYLVFRNVCFAPLAVDVERERKHFFLYIFPALSFNPQFVTMQEWMEKVRQQPRREMGNTLITMSPCNKTNLRAACLFNYIVVGWLVAGLSTCLCFNAR